MYNLEQDRDKYYVLGKIIKTYGYRGELMVLLDTDRPEDYAGLPMAFINMEQSLVPWFFEQVEITDDRARIKIEDIDTPEQARLFLGREVYLPMEELPRLDRDNFYFHEIIGYTAIDDTHGEIGRIDAILERPGQELIRIMKGKKEILIPLTDEMISGIDKKNRILELSTTPGLIELYLG